VIASRPRAAPPALIAGSVLLGGLLVLVLLSFVWLPYDPRAMDIPQRLAAPSWAHLFGTDAYGRDVLSNVIAGGRTSLAVAFFSLLIGAGAGIPIGLVAAAAGGWPDDVLARLNDVVFAFPALLIAVLFASVAGPGAIDAVAAIGIFNIPVFARITRSAAIGIGQRDYVVAAIAAGQTRARIVTAHILPNLAPALLVQAAIQASLAILAEAGLSYVGLGSQPPMPSWGRMLDGAQTLIESAPWLALFPGLAILVTTLALSLLGDGLRDALDPRARWRGAD
jgi:peptide/nickel transport system permease protein